MGYRKNGYFGLTSGHIEVSGLQARVPGSEFLLVYIILYYDSWFTHHGPLGVFINQSLIGYLRCCFYINYGTAALGVVLHLR